MFITEIFVFVSRCQSIRLINFSSPHYLHGITFNIFNRLLPTKIFEYFHVPVVNITFRINRCDYARFIYKLNI